MPKPRAGFVSLRIELPEFVGDAIRADAERRDESVNGWITRACAKRLGIPYEPRKPGRPVTKPPAAKPKRKRGGP